MDIKVSLRYGAILAKSPRAIKKVCEEALAEIERLEALLERAEGQLAMFAYYYGIRPEPPPKAETNHEAIATLSATVSDPAGLATATAYSLTPEPEKEEAAPKQYAARYWGQEVELPPIGTLIKIDWRDQLNDWPYFVIVDSARDRIKIKGADYPDGTAKYNGATFWAEMNEIKSLVEVCMEADSP